MVSVIIPVYNRFQTIQYCIESVLIQSYQDFEIIVVDDLSTDNTCDIVESLKDARIRLIKLDKKGGAQVARNKGIIEARGEWIAFLDSDDLWEDKKLEIQVDELKKHNFDSNIVIHCNCFCCSGICSS